MMGCYVAWRGVPACVCRMEIPVGRPPGKGQCQFATPNPLPKLPGAPSSVPNQLGQTKRWFEIVLVFFWGHRFSAALEMVHKEFTGGGDGSNNLHLAKFSGRRLCRLEPFQLASSSHVWSSPPCRAAAALPLPARPGACPVLCLGPRVPRPAGLLQRGPADPSGALSVILSLGGQNAFVLL